MFASPKKVRTCGLIPICRDISGDINLIFLTTDKTIYDFSGECDKYSSDDKHAVNISHFLSRGIIPEINSKKLLIDSEFDVDLMKGTEKIKYIFKTFEGIRIDSRHFVGFVYCNYFTAFEEDYKIISTHAATRQKMYPFELVVIKLKDIIDAFPQISNATEITYDSKKLSNRLTLFMNNETFRNKLEEIYKSLSKKEILIIKDVPVNVLDWIEQNINSLIFPKVPEIDLSIFK